MPKHENRGSVIKCQCGVKDCPRCQLRREYVAAKLLAFCQRTKHVIEIKKHFRRMDNKVNNKVYREKKDIREIETMIADNVKKRLTTRSNKGTLRSVLEPVFGATE